MKKLSILALALLSVTTAFAQSTTSTSAAQQQQQNTVSTSGAAASNQGNSQNITFTSPAQTATTVIQAGGTSSSMTVNGDTMSRQQLSGGTDSTVRSEYGSQTIRNTPSVSGPPLISSNDTCMGSASGSANVPGFGLSLGKTYTDSNCVMLKNSRELWNMGMKAAALALMCTDSANREALEITGFECPKRK